MHCRVNEASSTSSVHFPQTINSIIRFFSISVPHLELTKSRKKLKAGLLSQLIQAKFRRIASRQLAKPADEGPHNSAWALEV